MAFINSEVNLNELPALEQVPLTPIHPGYFKVLRTEWLLRSAFLTAIAVALILFTPEIRESLWWIAVVMILLVLTIPSYILLQKGFPYKAFAVRERDVAYQSGWLIRNQKICPFNRIQNCNIQAGLLERKYGLASLILYTAGTTGADITIPGLEQEEAERIRQFILSKINAAD
jgi:membrane protein YdbS with pleckstrin-like domain